MTFNLSDTIGIYVNEEQEFYMEIYKSSFETECSFKFIGVSSSGNTEELKKVLSLEKPDILVMGTRKISPPLLQELEFVRSTYPQIGLVILMTSIGDVEAKLLRKFIQKCHNGLGVYLKQSLDSPRQLQDIIRAVKQSQIVLDPTVANLILMERAEYPFLKDLTDRELEILNLLAQGYTNHGIAKALYIDIKTVAHHLNNIYSKMKYSSEMDEKHPRVSVARLYLETTGELMPFNAKNAVPLYPET
jgi:DNA-binding NarL/FixJ family response regulator